MDGFSQILKIHQSLVSSFDIHRSFMKRTLMLLLSYMLRTEAEC